MLGFDQGIGGKTDRLAAGKRVRKIRPCYRKGQPDVAVITGALDQKLNGKSYLVPGPGDVRDRLFGTKQGVRMVGRRARPTGRPNLDAH